MFSLLALFNRLLPFATPGTPFVQDLVHLAAICTLLYYGPNIQQWLQQRLEGSEAGADHDQENINIVPEAHEHGGSETGEPALLHAEENDVALEGTEAPALNGTIEGAGTDNNDLELYPGRANRRPPHAPRNIGAKKMKTLARRDQRHRYFEFVRSQGEAQRARDAEGAAEREAALAAERERRRIVEAEIDSTKARERESRREAEKLERELATMRREAVLRNVRQQLEECRMCNLWKVADEVGGDADEEWVERTLKASNILGKREDVMTMITQTGWAVRINAEDICSVYERAMTTGERSNGSVAHEELGDLLNLALFDRVKEE